MILALLFVLVGSSHAGVSPGGMLYPRESRSREVRSLDGIWNFLLNPAPEDQWHARNLKAAEGVIHMPVPSSYNDITQDKSVRDYVGPVLYDRTFYVPKSWQSNQRVWLRFGSVVYEAQVWINGNFAVSHKIGHLPFQADISTLLRFGEENHISVMVDNILTAETIPQGYIEEIQLVNETKQYLSYSFDFFHYSGIHRSVHLYTTPLIYIDDITVITDIRDTTGIIHYNVSYGGTSTSENLACNVHLLDALGNVVHTDNVGGFQGTIEVSNAKLWWPYLMDPNPGYLYTLQVIITNFNDSTFDTYSLPVGIRKIEWSNTTVLINKRPLYIRGFGKHEDSHIRGKGLDNALIVKDFNLLKWIGANAFRTSHYPYSEEIMNYADQEGIMIIDECPSVNTEFFTTQLLSNHQDSLEELIRRDKNHPSVIMWSIANEPRTENLPAETYFWQVSEFVRKLDSTRPITMAASARYDYDYSAQFMDVISFNRYNSWYSHSGKTEVIQSLVETEAVNWFRRYNRPVLMSEYGADTMIGVHSEPEYIWSEEYQKVVLSEHFKAFDSLRNQGFFIGEMIWNFADFNTAQTYTRVLGNRKGIFTRDRQPKSAAYIVKDRYFNLANEIDNAGVRIKEIYTSPKKLHRSEL